MRDSQLRYGHVEIPTLNESKSGAKLLSVEIPTLNESKSKCKCVGVSCCCCSPSRYRRYLNQPDSHRGVRRQLNRHHCHVRRRYGQGESISPSFGLSTFFYVLIHQYCRLYVREIGVFEYSFSHIHRLTDFRDFNDGGYSALPYIVSVIGGGKSVT